MEKNPQKTAFWLALMASFSFAAACSQANQSAKKKGDKDKAAEQGNDDDEGGDQGTDDLPDLGEEAGGGDDGDAAEKLAEDCGGKGLTGQDPDVVVYEKELESLPIVKTRVILISITATIKTKLSIKVTGAETVQETDVQIVKLAPDGPLTRPTAEKEAAGNSGKTTLTNVPFKDYPDLSKDQQWDGVLCTFVPVTKVVNERGGKKTVATFDPPLPSSVSPRATAERYKEEIGDKRVFKNIKVKVTSTDSPDLKKGETLSANVTVEKVKANVEVDDGEGGKKSIKSDLAYKVTYDIKSPKKTFALGFPPEVTYYISYAKKDLVANTVDTTATGENGAELTFIHEK